jgi:hypothetical protein
MRFTARLGFLLLAVIGAARSADAAVDNESAVAEALIRWHIATQKLERNPAVRLYVSVDGQDLSAQAIQDLRDTGLEFLPQADFKPSDPGAHVGTNWRLHIGKMLLRTDGDYEVNWGYYCGTLCAANSTAIVHHDGSGWHVVKSQLHWVS